MSFSTLLMVLCHQSRPVPSCLSWSLCLQVRGVVPRRLPRRLVGQERRHHRGPQLEADLRCDGEHGGAFMFHSHRASAPFIVVWRVFRDAGLRTCMWGAFGCVVVVLSLLLTSWLRASTPVPMLVNHMQVKSGVWDANGVFIYTTLNHIK
jgi:hypothetical protein